MKLTNFVEATRPSDGLDNLRGEIRNFSESKYSLTRIYVSNLKQIANH